jgi:zinc D-Ala-D-Ala carboxypeptidase
MRLSPSFTLDEFLRSDMAQRHGITEQFDPPPQVIENLQRLVDFVLQPLRDALDSPIRITSGYRCARLNELVKGKPTSQHLIGQAADCEFFVEGEEKNLVLYEKVKLIQLDFDQMIKEFGTEHSPAWIHLSYKQKGNRRQELTIL